MEQLSRRHFLVRASAVSLGFAGLQSGLAKASVRSLIDAGRTGGGFGPLLPDPAGVLDLPTGFSYKIISRQGETMDDGLIVPGKHDGMAAFPSLDAEGRPDGRTIIVRNHEVEDRHRVPSPFGDDGSLVSKIDPSKIYEPGFGKPSRGGTTTLVYDTRTGELESHFMSLAGTERNCAGGPTPRNTWISCEETVSKKSERFERDHGWCFEVPATAEPGLADPKPILGMGRFNHEAVCVDPRTGYVYLTEDREDGLLYRFLPNDTDDYHAGGTLQALAVVDRPSLDTRNWEERTVSVGQRFPVEWITMDNTDSPNDDLRHRGRRAGATRFARGEGMWWGQSAQGGTAYFACTTGGRKGAGQLWKLIPGRSGDQLELFIEPDDRSVLENADNITFSPWGDVIVCEDGRDPQFLVGVTPDGSVYKLGKNSMNGSELAGACFSPDGTTLFVNIQGNGWTLAITGPWESARR